MSKYDVTIGYCDQGCRYEENNGTMMVVEGKNYCLNCFMKYLKELDAKAEKWDLLMSSARIQIQGSAGLRDDNVDGYCHMGLALWSIVGEDYPIDNTYAIESLEKYVKIVKQSQEMKK